MTAKPRLSGAARRKLAREEAAKAFAERGVVMPAFTVGSLNTVRDYRAELNKVYRAARMGQMRPEDATKLAFIVNLGAQLSRVEEELANIEGLRRAVEEVQGQQAISYQPAPEGTQEASGAALVGELLPAHRPDDGDAL
jgi:hypothetical protein